MQLLIKYFIFCLISINAFSLKVGADSLSPVGGVKYTIKDGVVYDAKQLLRDVADRVQAAKALAAQRQTVVLETTAGEIHIELYGDKAPLSVQSFLTAVDTGIWLNGEGGFYRVVRENNAVGQPNIEVIQGGVLDYTKGLPLIEHESTQQTGILHRDGTVSLGRAPDSTGSGSLFFICIGDQPSLDYGGARNPDGQGFAAFGQVTKGMDVVRRIQGMNTQDASAEQAYQQQQLLEPVSIIKAYRK